MSYQVPAFTGPTVETARQLIDAGWLRWLPFDTFVVCATLPGFPSDLHHPLWDQAPVEHGERAMNARIRARTARVATHLGQPLPATRADLFGLLQVLGVVVADGFSWRFGSDIPHVVDVGFLTEIEAADEQAVRLRREHDTPGALR